MRLTEDLPKDSKQRGEMATLYAQPQGLRGWMATVATHQSNRHTKLPLQGKGYSTPTAATILT